MNCPLSHNLAMIELAIASGRRKYTHSGCFKWAMRVNLLGTCYALKWHHIPSGRGTDVDIELDDGILYCTNVGITPTNQFRIYDWGVDGARHVD